jgi:hypothetical protein
METLDEVGAVGGGRNLNAADLAAEIEADRIQLEEERRLLEGARLQLAASLTAGSGVDLAELLARRAEIAAEREAVRKEMALATAELVGEPGGKLAQRKMVDWDGNIFWTFDSQKAGIEMNRSMWIRRMLTSSRRSILLESDGVKINPTYFTTGSSVAVKKSFIRDRAALLLDRS